MTTITDEDINNLVRQKHDLIRQYDNNEITTRKYNNQYEKIVTTLEQKTREIINEKIEKARYKEKETVNTKRALTRQLNKLQQENRANAGRKVNPESFSSIILQALIDETLNTEKKVSKHVAKKKKCPNDKKLANKIRVIISYIKHNKGARYKEYKWNNDMFTAVKK